ncbi:MAG: hypothetical protein H6575_02645 [Lewinellaceae bacterium]|nr:hypothetical protein [Lewinellaceae bacterium]
MLAQVRYWYQLAYAAVWLALGFARAARYFRTRALHDLALPHPEALHSGEKRRLKHYFYGTTYLGIVFCLLHGRTRSRQERHLFTNLAALAYYFDDLVDLFRGQDGSDILWRNNPEAYGALADQRGLALHLLHNIYSALPPGDLHEFKDFMHRVFNVETAGRQVKGNISDAELQHITAEKGGFSVLLFRRVLASPLPQQEREALYDFGALVQLCDDIFDLWHDRQAGTETLATRYAAQSATDALIRSFERQVQALETSFDGLRQQKLAGGHALGSVHFLIAITRVCLQHYAELQKKHGTLPLDDRTRMVVDMERWPNRLRAAKALLMNRPLPSGTNNKS